MSGVGIAVHGGAGAFARERRDAPALAAMRRALAECVDVARAALARGEPALDVVERAVAALEDDPLFNAGCGASLTCEGQVELDASIMDGRTRAAGAVAAVARLANPVSAARLVMERTPHVLLVGPAAERFALAQGAREAPPGSLATEARRRELARDAWGHLAAATSTGGLAAKLPGRVGDSALPGAGTWADDATCAVSGTGHGEAFVRCALAHEVDARIRHRGESIDRACDAALARVSALGHTGGCIALGRTGAPVLRFTSAGMARGWIDADGGVRVAIFPDE